MEIHFYATLRPIVGGKRVEAELVDGATVRELIDYLTARFPELDRMFFDKSSEPSEPIRTGSQGLPAAEHPGGRPLSRRVHFFVDGRSAIYLEDGLETQISGLQRIDVFPAIAGG